MTHLVNLWNASKYASHEDTESAHEIKILGLRGKSNTSSVFSNLAIVSLQHCVFTPQSPQCCPQWLPLDATYRLFCVVWSEGKSLLRTSPRGRCPWTPRPQWTPEQGSADLHRKSQNNRYRFHHRDLEEGDKVQASLRWGPHTPRPFSWAQSDDRCQHWKYPTARVRGVQIKWRSRKSKLFPAARGLGGLWGWARKHWRREHLCPFPKSTLKIKETGRAGGWGPQHACVSHWDTLCPTPTNESQHNREKNESGVATRILSGTHRRHSSPRERAPSSVCLRLLISNSTGGLQTFGMSHKSHLCGSVFSSGACLTITPLGDPTTALWSIDTTAQRLWKREEICVSREQRFQGDLAIEDTSGT